MSAYFKDNALAWRLTLAGKRLAGSEAPMEEAVRSHEEKPDDGVFTEEEVVSCMETEKSQAEEKVKQTVEEILPQPEPEKPQEEAPETEEIPEWVKKGLRPIRPMGPNFWERLGAKLAQVESVWVQFQAYPISRRSGTRLERPEESFCILCGFVEVISICILDGTIRRIRG